MNMKYNAEQRIYFQLETVTHILDEVEMEICDMEMGNLLDQAKYIIREISMAAYRKASKSE